MLRLRDPADVVAFLAGMALGSIALPLTGLLLVREPRDWGAAATSFLLFGVPALLALGWRREIVVDDRGHLTEVTGCVGFRRAAALGRVTAVEVTEGRRRRGLEITTSSGTWSSGWGQIERMECDAAAIRVAADLAPIASVDIDDARRAFGAASATRRRTQGVMWVLLVGLGVVSCALATDPLQLAWGMAYVCSASLLTTLIAAEPRARHLSWTATTLRFGARTIPLDAVRAWSFPGGCLLWPRGAAPVLISFTGFGAWQFAGEALRTAITVARLRRSQLPDAGTYRDLRSANR